MSAFIIRAVDESGDGASDFYFGPFDGWQHAREVADSLEAAIADRGLERSVEISRLDPAVSGVEFMAESMV